ncbi:hypothetical protein LCGC14_3048790 [marine sediment metagenome]|uniref:Uncharacterized protein n=1 Tax=marine sediment metagenome TaxID=412755 RepID=A0A0F8WMA5_9ZZZZ
MSDKERNVMLDNYDYDWWYEIDENGFSPKPNNAIAVSDALHEENRFMWDHNKVDYLRYCERAVYDDDDDFDF